MRAAAEGRATMKARRSRAARAARPVSEAITQTITEYGSGGYLVAVPPTHMTGTSTATSHCNIIRLITHKMIVCGIVCAIWCEVNEQRWC